jgi:hypothetical protein
MPKCPNCGLETLRTEDWACQWCGYPLISSSYKKIPKTYNQLKQKSLNDSKSELEGLSQSQYQYQNQHNRLSQSQYQYQNQHNRLSQYQYQYQNQHNRFNQYPSKKLNRQ